MATTFKLELFDDNDGNLQNVADLCIKRIDELEMKLSRFIADSDISRINRLKNNQSILVDLETHHCLKEAIEVSSYTVGHFDIGTAELSNIYRGYQQNILNEFEFGKAIDKAIKEKSEATLYVTPDKPEVTCVNEGMKLDLGGIGKGYALDELAKICVEFQIPHYSLSAGGSTVLIGGKHEFNYSLTSKKQKIDVQLQTGAISASGISQQGYHIFNPKSGQNELMDYQRIWVHCHKASYSDAYGTAFFSMDLEAIEKVIENSKQIIWVAYAKNDEINFIDINN